MTKALYRSLYWRIGLGFILCIGGVLALQGTVLLALLNRLELQGQLSAA